MGNVPQDLAQCSGLKVKTVEGGQLSGQLPCALIDLLRGCGCSAGGGRGHTSFRVPPRSFCRLPLGTGVGLACACFAAMRFLGQEL